MISSLYALELEPGEHKHAKWYVGITKNVEQRMSDHYVNSMVKWVFQNEVVDYIVVGEWNRTRSRQYEDNLTALLMHEYGWRTTRGGNWTDPYRPGIPDRNFSDVSGELIRALADTDHEGLLRLVEKYPLFSYQNSVTGSRVDHDLKVYEDTKESAEEAHGVLENRIGADFHEYDVREAIFIVGMYNLDQAEELLRQWSADCELKEKDSDSEITLE